MARGRLWGYVASGARALGALGGTVGAFGGAGGASGAGRRGGRSGRSGAPAAAAEEARGPFSPGAMAAMAAPRSLSRTELERLRWTGRQAGCEPTARHVQVADVVRRVVRGGGRAAAVTVRVTPGLPVVAGDARRLEAAVAGLVDQAIRRSPPGGPVLLRADVAGGTSTRRAPDRAAAARGRVEIRVSDQGSYEPPEAHERRIAGTPADGPVGPALYSLVEAAGGRLAVEPTPGGGLTVILLLTVAYD
ncbi:sensor histidine kinase [Kitasatospora sp. NPDC058444]|uniref:sensor histidine kinase n=1 Tax=Kitasatospora sp. NPDC058444 TaxID=3346504 RepID=UPI00364CE1F4